MSAFTKQLRHIADVRVSNVDKKSAAGERAVALCNYTDVYYRDVITVDQEFMRATATTEQVRRFTLCGGDTLITKDSETADDIGISAFVPSDLPDIVCGYHLALIRPKATVDGRFLSWALQSDFVRGQWAVLATGVTRYGLNYGAIRGTDVPMPPLDVQRRIADFLDDQVTRIDRAVQLRRQQTELVRQRLVGRIEEETCHPGDPRVRLKSQVREVDERIGCEVDPGELLSVSIHLGVVPRSQVTDDLPRAESLANYKVVKEGDIVLNRMRAFQGAVGVAHRSGIVSPDYAVLRAGSSCDSGYLHHLFRAPWFVGEMTSRLRGIGSVEQGNVRTPRVNVEDLLMTMVPLPGLATQRRRRWDLDRESGQTERCIDNLEKAGSLLAERKRSLITAAVTGEFDVFTASSRASGVVMDGVGG